MITRKSVISWVVGLALLLIAILAVYASFNNSANVALSAVTQEWPKMEACSGLRHSLDERIKVVTTSNSDNGAVDPLYTEAYRNDTLFLAKNWKDSSWLVKHGILHALLSPVTGHPKKYFGEKCGDLMHGRPFSSK